MNMSQLAVEQRGAAQARRGQGPGAERLWTTGQWRGICLIGGAPGRVDEEYSTAGMAVLRLWEGLGGVPQMRWVSVLENSAVCGKQKRGAYVC